MSFDNELYISSTASGVLIDAEKDSCDGWLYLHEHNHMMVKPLIV